MTITQTDAARHAVELHHFDSPIEPELLAEKVQSLLGFGYDSCGHYCDEISKRAPIIDVSDLAAACQIDKAEKFVSNESSEYSFKSYYQKLDIGIDAEGTYAGYSAQFKAYFGAELSENQRAVFLTYLGELRYNVASLLPNLQVLPAAQKAIDTADPADLFRDYGTHFLDQIQLGAQIFFTSHLAETSWSSTISFDALIRAAYESWTSGGASYEGEHKATYDAIVSSVDLRVMGGEPSLAHLVKQQSSDPVEAKSSYIAWAQTVAEQPVLSGMRLRSIADLATTPERQTALETATDAYLVEHGIKLRDLAPPQPVKKNDHVQLFHNTGKPIGTAHNGWYYWYPMLRASAQNHTLASGIGALLSGDRLVIKTDEKFDKGSDQVILGRFADVTIHEAYYHKEFGDKTEWVIDKSGGAKGDSINYGDPVTIKNVANDEYLIVAADSYLTTGTTAESWLFEPVA